MKLKDVKIGDKFYHLDEKGQSSKMYLKINLDIRKFFPTLASDYTEFSDLVPALDLSTYRICCLNTNYEVEVEYDNIHI